MERNGEGGSVLDTWVTGRGTCFLSGLLTFDWVGVALGARPDVLWVFGWHHCFVCQHIAILLQETWVFSDAPHEWRSYRAPMNSSAAA